MARPGSLTQPDARPPTASEVRVAVEAVALSPASPPTVTAGGLRRWDFAPRLIGSMALARH